MTLKDGDAKVFGLLNKISGSNRLRNLARYLGMLLTVVSLIYISRRIVADPKSIENLTAWAFLKIMPGVVAIYAIAQTLTGVGWVFLVDGSSSKTRLGFRNGLLIFGKSQIFKYLPTNVLHVVGRYSLAQSAGASHASLVFATLMEPLLLIGNALFLSVIFSLPLTLNFAKPIIHMPWSVLIVIAFAFLGFAIIRMIWSRLDPTLDFWFVVGASGIYLSFFLLNALALWLLIKFGGSPSNQSYAILVGLLAVAWLCGYITPGSPAGIGVREAVLVAGLSSAGDVQSPLAIAVGYRLVALLGDVIIAVIANFWPACDQHSSRL